MKKEKSCGTIIIDSNKRVLLVRQKLGWVGFPKGHMEQGETEIAEIMWVDIDEAKQYLSYDNLKQLWQTVLDDFYKELV